MLGTDDGWLLDRPERYPVLVGERDGEIVGWSSLSQWSPRGAYARTAEVSVYVDGPQRGNGYGRELLAAVVDLAPELGAGTLLAPIVEANPASIGVHKQATRLRAHRHAATCRREAEQDPRRGPDGSASRRGRVGRSGGRWADVPRRPHRSRIGQIWAAREGERRGSLGLCRVRRACGFCDGLAGADRRDSFGTTIGSNCALVAEPSAQRPQPVTKAAHNVTDPASPPPHCPKASPTRRQPPQASTPHGEAGSAIEAPPERTCSARERSGTPSIAVPVRRQLTFDLGDL